jgi:Cdc6-like AAA superfamily ATPase
MPVDGVLQGGRHLARVRVPETVVGRTAEQAAIRQVVDEPGQSHLHITGQRGNGKTLLTAVALTDAPVPVCYVPCRRYNTQYQVLARLTAMLTGEPVPDGYRTAQLERRVATALTETPAVLVLDDVEFLLQNDGDALLYSLSRMDRAERLTIMTLTTPLVDLTAMLDERTSSSYQPRHVAVEPYTDGQTAEILRTHARDLVPQPVTDTAVRQVARQTANIHVGLHWLARAGEVHDAHAVITAKTLQLLRWDAFDRYGLDTVTAFTRHHAIVLKAIQQVTGETPRVYTGTVYDRYVTLCRCRGWEPLTARRIGDYLNELELLGLIDVEQYRGGTEGKTRLIRLTPLEEL